jgi:nicotinate-nucleotide--dimethylbenzimidazole phosphoribosyltransferase
MVLKPEIAVFVSNQAVENALNADMPTITQNNIQALQAGKHIINQACNVAGCGLKTYDLNTTIPTEDIRTEAAMSDVEATQIMAYSMESVRDSDLLIITELGCHQKIAAQAIIKTLFHDCLPENCIFPDFVNQAVDFHGVYHEPLEVLRRLGSREIAAMVGAIIAARYQNVPIILDGLSAVVAAAVVAKINPNAIHHCLLGHSYDDNIYDFLNKQLGLEPINLLNVTHDAGIGSMVAVQMIKTALAIHNYAGR